MVLSSWCHRQIQSLLLPGCHLHLTQYPLYLQYLPSLFRSICFHGVATPDVMHFFLSPPDSCQRFCMYHSLLFSLSLTGKKVYLTYTSIFSSQTIPFPYRVYSHVFLFFSPLHTLGRLVFLAYFLYAFHPRTFLYNNTLSCIIVSSYILLPFPLIFCNLSECNTSS